MPLQTLATIIGIIIGGGTVSLGFLRALIKVYDFYSRLESLERQNTQQTIQVQSFRTEFQTYFLRAEQQDEERWKIINGRLARTEKALIVWIAKNQGTIPPLGED